MYILQTIQFVWRSFQASSQTGQVHCCLSTFISFFDIFFFIDFTGYFAFNFGVCFIYFDFIFVNLVILS